MCVVSSFSLSSFALNPHPFPSSSSQQPKTDEARTNPFPSPRARVHGRDPWSTRLDRCSTTLYSQCYSSFASRCRRNSQSFNIKLLLLLLLLSRQFLIHLYQPFQMAIFKSIERFARIIEKGSIDIRSAGSIDSSQLYLFFRFPIRIEEIQYSVKNRRDLEI